MAPSRAKTAFQYFQSAKLAEIKQELGGASMGQAMTVLSQRWKSLSDDEKQPYVDLEQEDRTRFQQESAQADALAIQVQEERRAALQVQEGEGHGSRGARAKIEEERELKEERKRRRQEALDPELVAERKRLRDAKKQETMERQRLRQQEEDLVKERHRKLDKQQAQKAHQRLDYLLKQSSIFAKLKGGPPDQKAAPLSPSGKSHHRDDKIHHDESDEVDEEEEEHVFLTKQPDSIKFGQLKPYQLEALNWMIHLAEKGLNGILADEMGLGKTLQSISMLAYMSEFQNIQGPHLIVVPKSTLSNWMNELKRWCPSLRAIRFHGMREDREALIAEYFTNEAAAHDGKRPTKPQIRNAETGEMEDDNSENPRAWDVCVTTYEVCNTERKTLQKFAWKYLVIDEAHRLKNEASLFSKVVRTLHTQHRLLLTGTPLQNNLHELWALLNFLLPDIFSSAEQFDEWFDLEIDDEDAKKQMISQLHKILRPFMLRRLKADVAKGLPPKTETLVMVGMSTMQKKLYKSLLLRDIDSITSNNNKNRTAVLNIVMQLRKCCGHPYLFDGIEDRTLDPLGEHLVENCGKLTMVDKLLKKLKERGSRVLIFTQMTRILDILEDFMVMRGYGYCRIDGNTEYEKRESAIDDFNREGSDKFCFILSTRAGGLGINLQTADTCILYDSDWNPQSDLQAQDRCHRLGQKKPVNIYRLVSENTVEEKIVERAQQKLKLDAMVVQQGRLKDKDKVSKEEIMAAVRFGADTVFRSEESTITDDDIDIILERGKAKTKELAEKIQKAEKGDLLDFRMDGGISAQTFEGVDYSDKELRNQLRLLAADSVGKRERRPPPADYTPITEPKKSMVVNDTRIKLPKTLRLPRMEDHMFYNRQRLLELSSFEFQTYATLRERGQLPSREYIKKSRTLLPPELAREKLELLDEGFGNWTRSEYYQFVKALTKYGRDDLTSLANEMDMPEETVAAYGRSFFKYGPTELKKEEWERVITTIERGERRLAKRKKTTALLSTFISTFDNPREEMVFANKGTTHFSLEQDRALLCAANEHGHGNWDSIRDEIRNDNALAFQHMVQGMNTDMIAKRVDYRMRQMEKEYEAREKFLKNEKPPSVVAAQKAIAAIKETDEWETEARDRRMRGGNAPSMIGVSDEGKAMIAERANDRESIIDRLREVEMQVRGAKAIAEETREAIMRGDQYVNYSNVTLKEGGKRADILLAIGEDVEGKINAEVLGVPECGECRSCLDDSCHKLCHSRLRKREELIKREMKRIAKGGGKKTSKKRKHDASKGPKPKSTTGKALGKRKPLKKPNGAPRVTSLGNKRMSIPDEQFPEFCRRIGAHGTGERMKLINTFVDENPEVSTRQVTIKFSEITTRKMPSWMPEKPKGKTFMFYLRGRFYHLLPENARPENWQKYAAEDELLWKEEQRQMEKEKKEKAQSTKAAAEAKSAPTSEAESAVADGDSDGEPLKKKGKV